MSAFRLQPYEDGIGGVDHRDGVLRLRRSRGATGLTLSGTVFALLLVVAGVSLGIVWYLLAGIVAPPSARYLFCRVVAPGIKRTGDVTGVRGEAVS